MNDFDTWEDMDFSKVSYQELLSYNENNSLAELLAAVNILGSSMTSATENKSEYLQMAIKPSQDDLEYLYQIDAGAAETTIMRAINCTASLAYLLEWTPERMEKYLLAVHQDMKDLFNKCFREKVTV